MLLVDIFFYHFTFSKANKATKMQGVTECERIKEKNYYVARTIKEQELGGQMLIIGFKFLNIEFDWITKIWKSDRQARRPREETVNIERAVTSSHFDCKIMRH